MKDAAEVLPWRAVGTAIVDSGTQVAAPRLEALGCRVTYLIHLLVLTVYIFCWEVAMRARRLFKFPFALIQANLRLNSLFTS